MSRFLVQKKSEYIKKQKLAKYPLQLENNGKSEHNL